MMKQMIDRVAPTAMAHREPDRAPVAMLQRRLRWRRWRVSMPDQPELLTSAELSECACPDLCHRDHGND